GLVVWSRGGSNDAYSDVFYLSNHATLTPHGAPDLPPYWVGKTHCALVVPLDAEPTLIVDVPDWRRDLVTVEDVRYAPDLTQAVADVLSQRNLARSRLGLVGGNALEASPYRYLLAAVPHATFEFAGDMLERLRMVKSAVELELVREAAAA